MRVSLPILVTIAALAAGCGTTRWSDTSRTGTEQLLLSDAIDRAVSNFDFRALAGKQIYFDATYLKTSVDADYLVGSLRQHALASGCILRAKAEEADYVVEIRSGAIGTDRHDVLLGVPATNIPATTFTAGMGAQIPELPLLKKTDQRAVAKIALFAYNRQTGRPVWQSGSVPVESSARAFWVFGAGPFRRGHIHQGTDFAGEKVNIPLMAKDTKEETIPVAAEAYFIEPPRTATEIARRNAPASTPTQPAAKDARGGGPPSPPVSVAGPPANAVPPGAPSSPAPSSLPPDWQNYPQTMPSGTLR
jgi:hypothetical protein